jgi:hypothetical protein
MSHEVIGCFGKLPFTLLEQLQREFVQGGQLWADAGRVPGTADGIASIDSIALDESDLSGSVSLSILHSANDIFAANGIPSCFCVSLILPTETDCDELSIINSEIARVATLLDSQIAKIHTSRLPGVAVSTVAAFGKRAGRCDPIPASGVIRLIGDYAGEPVRIPSGTVARNLSDRCGAVAKLRGPKKDVSGDGLAGALCQLAKRHALDLAVSATAICSNVFGSASGVSERNYLDYAAQLQGLSGGPSLLLQRLFCGRVFGPLVCLTDILDVGDESVGPVIGHFKAGRGTVGIVDP